MQEGVGHVDYPRGSSDYPISGGKRGLGKDAFVPIEDLSDGENPEDLLIASQEGNLDKDEEEENLLRGLKVMEEDKRIYPAIKDPGQGSAEVVGLRKSVGTMKVDRGGDYGLPVKNIREKRIHLDRHRGKAERGKK